MKISCKTPKPTPPPMRCFNVWGIWDEGDKRITFWDSMKNRLKLVIKGNTKISINDSWPY